MYIRLHAPVVTGPYKFDFWAYSEKDKISRGSGLFVSQSGVVCDNHFMLRFGASNSDKHLPLPQFGSDDHFPVPQFLFWPGEYTVEVFANVLGRSTAAQLMRLKFTISGQQAGKMSQRSDAGIFFDLDSETCSYVGHFETRIGKSLDVWRRFGEAAGIP